MNANQIILFTLLFIVFVFLIWGRWRYGVVAFFALLARFVVSGTRKLAAHISIMSSLAAVLSALMKNVAALVLPLPVSRSSR